MRIVYPGLYKQVESLGLRTIVCTCGCAVFASGINMQDAHIRLTCLSCGLSTGKMAVIDTKSTQTQPVFGDQLV